MQRRWSDPAEQKQMIDAALSGAKAPASATTRMPG
jgi:hypothetical protein